MGVGGSVNNLTTNAIISGGQYGVYITGGAGTVINAGTIRGTNSAGVYLGAGGSVNNLSGGTNYGGIYGVAITGGAGYVTNAGTITGGFTGVYMGAGGSVSNLTGGIITGGTNGVYITNGIGSVVNAGTIIGTNNDGVYMGATATNGSVNNLAGGTITGGINGVEFAGAAGSVTNSGSITGYARDGVYMGANGNVNNLAGGFIFGKTNGVEIDGAGSVVNAGTIIGTNRDGIYLSAGGSVDNSQGRFARLITGGANGVEITGGAGYVTNSGSIIGTNSDGIYMGTNGSVNNLTGGIITGLDGDGVRIIGGTGSVVNAGSITGAAYYGYGVAMVGGGGSVDNLTNGIITGNYDGIDIYGGVGSVVNAGSIIGTVAQGVYFGTNGSVNNLTGGIIQGGFAGVYIPGGAGYVTNAGTIIGNGGTAISLSPFDDTVVLQTGSIVQGNIEGSAGTDAAFLQGHGSYSNNFVNFETLTVQGDTNVTGWNLTGTNTFSTNAIVQTGLLRINGSLTSAVVVVSNGATLGGAGTVYGAVESHGVISPGNSISNFNIVGSLNMTNSIYNEEVNAAGQSDRIVVSGSPGTAMISNAVVVVLPAHEVYGTSTVYTNLTATGGVFGTNASISISTNVFSFPSWLGFAASLQYVGTNTVTTTLSRNSFATSAGNTHNRNSVAGALDGIVLTPGSLSNLVSEFFWLGSASAARAALDSMSGEIHGSLGMLDVQQQNVFNNSIARRTGRISAGGEGSGYASAKPVQLASADDSTLPPMRQEEEPLAWDIWLQGFGSFGHLDGDGNASGGNYTISGTSGGLDYRLSPEMLVGLAVGYSHNSASVGGPGASGSVDAIQFAGYGGYVSGPWHLDGIFSYGFLQTDTKRLISVGSIQQTASGSYDGGVYSLSTEGGYAFEAGPMTIEPTLGLNYTHLSQNSFHETGTASDGHNYGLDVHSVKMDSFRSAVGVRLTAQFGEKGDVQFVPELRAGWEHEFLDKTADMNARFVGGSGDFNVHGVELGADSGVLGGGLTVSFNESIQGFVNYDARMNERLSSHTISGGLSYSW
jgi:outer membrane autotransporter protein